MTWLLVILPGFFAGLVQGLTGFGAAIIMMIFLPQLLPMAQGAGVAGLIMAASVITMVARYRHHIQFKRIIGPFIIYASVAAWSVHLGKVLDVQLLRTLLGGLLLALAIYFTVSKQAGTKPFPVYIAGMFMVISGFFNGLFGIGGPLMALYFLSLAKETETYIANLQTFFLLDVMTITSIRVGNGILSTADLPIVLIGMVGAILGTILAGRILPHLNMVLVRRLIYVFIGLSGCYYLVF